MPKTVANLIPLPWRLKYIRPLRRRVSKKVMNQLAWYRHRLTYYRLGLLDALDLLTGRRAELTPPPLHLSDRRQLSAGGRGVRPEPD
jgi:hypothetical protein